MIQVEPKIYLLASPAIDQAAVDLWLGDLYGKDVQFVTNAVTASEKIIEHAGRRCYKSHVIGANPNVSRKRDDIGDYLHNILRSRHGSVLEHGNFTFAIENVSRVLTHELVRHRAGIGISQESLMYVRLTDIGFWIPRSVRPQPGDDEITAKRKARTVELMISAVTNLEGIQRELAELWGMNDEKMPFSKKRDLTTMFRRLVPVGVATGMVWTANVRALRTVFEQRSTFHNDEEVHIVFSQMVKLMKKIEPNLFQDWNFDEKKGWAPEFSKV